MQIDEKDRPIFGAERIAKFLKLEVRPTYYLLSIGAIDADKLGGDELSVSEDGTPKTNKHGKTTKNKSTWVSTPRRLINSFARSRTEAA